MPGAVSMITDDEQLAVIAKDGTVDYDEWPALQRRLLDRLDHIIHNDFPRPPHPPALIARRRPPLPTSLDGIDGNDGNESQSSTTTNKENSPPPRLFRPPAPPLSIATSAPAVTTSDPDAYLPPDLQSLYTSITQTLSRTFSLAPPHTAQRLAELLLHPRQHYKRLSSYLSALDRILSVTSPLSLFPLPTSTVRPTENGTTTLFNGITSSAALGSDESLGGALLTPIPWLRDQQPDLHTESTITIDGPLGVGSVETVSIAINGVPHSTSIASSSGRQSFEGPASDLLPARQLAETMREAGAVTQGELLRQEQEAGVVPVNQTRQTRSATRAEARSVAAEAKSEGEEEEGVPHARGPELVGMEDMGPQGAERSGRTGFDVEAATGRKVEDGEEESEATLQHEEDTVLADADGELIGDGDGVAKEEEKDVEMI